VCKDQSETVPVGDHSILVAGHKTRLVQYFHLPLESKHIIPVFNSTAIYLGIIACGISAKKKKPLNF
jgi:hypothetical protein